MITTKNNHQEQLKYAKIPFEMMDNGWATSSDVIVYAFMLNRYLFFKSIGKPYFENIEDIAKGSRQGRATVTRSIKKLHDNNYIQISKVKVEVGCSNNYVVLDIHKIATDAHFEHSNGSKISFSDSHEIDPF